MEQESRFASLSRRELQACAKKHGLKANGKSCDIIRRLVEKLGTGEEVSSKAEMEEEHPQLDGENEQQASGDDVQQAGGEDQQQAGGDDVQQAGGEDQQQADVKGKDHETHHNDTSDQEAQDATDNSDSVANTKAASKTPRRKKVDFRKAHEKLFSAQKSIADVYSRTSARKAKANEQATKSDRKAAVPVQQRKSGRPPMSGAKSTTKVPVPNASSTPALGSIRKGNPALPPSGSTVASRAKAVNNPVRKATPLSKRSVFNLEESLKRPVTWELKKGPIPSTPDVSCFDKSIASSVKSSIGRSSKRENTLNRRNRVKDSKRSLLATTSKERRSRAQEKKSQSSRQTKVDKLRQAKA